MRLTRTMLARIRESELFTTLQANHELSLDSTFFEDVDSCDFQALLGGVLRLVSNRNESALVFGSAFHEALAHHYAHKHLGPSDPDKLVAIALREWDANPVSEDLKRNRQSLQTLVRAYLHEQLFGVDFEPAMVDSVPFVERGLETVLAEHNGYKLKWKGKIDMIVKERGDYWVVDHKTTSVMGEKFADDKYRSNQMLGYTFLARQVLGIPVKGVKINCAAFRTKGFEFQRFTLPISEHAVYEWAEEVAHKMQHLLELLLGLQEFMEPTRYEGNEPTMQLPFVGVCRSKCVTKYGKCRFFDVCQAFITQRDAFLFNSGEFKVSTFSPLSN